jgi:hypothetical protein
VNAILPPARFALEAGGSIAHNTFIRHCRRPPSTTPPVLRHAA